MEFILSRVLVISLAALALFFIPDAQAQEAKKVGTNKIDISITPRFQYVIINTNPTEIVDRSGTEETQIPFYGVSIGVAPRRMKNTDFILSAFYGTTDVDSSFNANSISDETTDVLRYDIEFLVRHGLEDSDVYVNYGFRYIHADADTTSLNAANTYAETGTTQLDTDLDYYLGQVGLGFTTAITKDFRYNLFGQANIAVGHFEYEITNRTIATDSDEDDIFVGGDLQMGIQVQFSDNASGHIRYRATLLEGPSQEHLLVHGPEIGLSISF